MITASHNPKEDNGFKAYNHTGAQINLEEAHSVIQEIKGINDIFSIEKADVSNIQFIDASFDNIYLDDIASIRIHQEVAPIKDYKNTEEARNFKKLNPIPKPSKVPKSICE